MASPDILLIDDEEFQLKLLSRQLAILGNPGVVTSTSGSAALELLGGRACEEMLIFLDLNVPGLDGVEFVRALVATGYAGALILVSGEDERILESAVRLARAHRLNVLGRMSKPVQMDALRALLDAWRQPLTKASRKEATRYAPDELRRAIAGGELVNYYQPKVDVGTGAMKGVETLVRWQHPTDGMVFPDQFIGVAEESGLIDDLTRVVLIAALEQARQWRDDGLTLRVAVNVSMDNLARLDFPDFVLTEVRRNGIAAGDLVLEVTQSRLRTDVVAALGILTRLRLKRVSLSIDDFGTGSSSLAQLRDIPFDELKIDRGFVHGAAHDNTRRAIFTASLAMAKQLGMTSVSEGVEDRADWDFVRRLGCDLAQGYFVAKPMPADGLVPWLLTWEARRPELVGA